MNIIENLTNWFIYETNIYIKALSLAIIIGLLYMSIKYLFIKIHIYRDRRSVFPFYNSEIIRKAKKDYVRTKYQNLDPSDEINHKRSSAFLAKEDLLNFFLKKVFRQNLNTNQFYLILGDSGTGKTTFCLNLISIYNSINNSLFTNRKIKLLPLGIDSDTLKNSLTNIKKPHKTILILDGFDKAPDIKHDEIQNEFDRLIDLVKHFKIVIITCRTQYFPSQKEESNELKIKMLNSKENGFYSIKKIYVSPFESEDIKKYINKTFHIFQKKQKRKAYNIVNNTNGLLARPMHLSYIKDLADDKEKSFETKTDIYEALILAWIEQDSNKYPENQRDFFKSNLSFYSYELTKFIYDNYEKNGLFIPLGTVEKLSKEFNIDLDKIELESRSLLNRNSGDQYKFSHKSIYEFLLAYLTYTSREAERTIINLNFDIHQYDHALSFFEEMVNNGKADFKLPELTNQYGESDRIFVRRIIKEKNKLDKKDNKKIVWLNNQSYELK
ncbi:MAG: ATP-binding protein [Bacteroidota bacterium]